MKLSKEQIGQLKDLISYKGHVYIDVQYEILDHVACKVEALIEEDAELSVDQAFRKVFASFGSNGFNELEASYQKMIEKKHRGYFWEELKLFLFSYKVFLVLGVFIFFYNMQVVFESPTGWISGLLVLFIACALFLAGIHWGKFKKYQKYAAFNISGNFFALIGFTYQLCSFSYIMLNNSLKNESIWSNYSLAAITTLLGLMYCCLFILPKVFERSQGDTEKLMKLYQIN